MKPPRLLSSAIRVIWLVAGELSVLKKLLNMHTLVDNRLVINYANKFIETHVGSVCNAKCCKPSTATCSVETDAPHLQTVAQRVGSHASKSTTRRLNPPTAID